MHTRPNRIPPLNARDLQVLVAIAHHGHLVAASAWLKLSPTALSRTVTRVEKLVGVKLFVRSTRRVEITPAGREFVGIAERMLNDVQFVLSNMRELATEQRGQVIISTFPIFAQETLPPIIRLFRETRPQIEIQLRTGRHPEVLGDVRSGLADFGITYGRSSPETVEQTDLRREPICVILPRDHPLARSRTPIRLAQLRDVPLVSLPRETHNRRLLEGAAATAGVTLRHAVLVPGFLEMISQVRAGVGVGLLPTGALPRSPHRDFAVRALTAPALSVPVSLLWLSERHMSPAASSFMTLVLTHLKSEPKALNRRVAGLTRTRPEGRAATSGR
jgi:DNA-binding transcriptional LysR family regulator